MLQMQIRELSTTTPQMTCHEENLIFMFHRVHGIVKEYEARPDCIEKLVCRLLVDLENAKAKLKKLVNVSKRSRERSEAICDAVRESETPSEELRRACSIAKKTFEHYMSRQGFRTYSCRLHEREAERKYGWDLAVQHYWRAIESYEAKFGEVVSLADHRYQSDEDVDG